MRRTTHNTRHGPRCPRHVVVCDVHGVAWRVLDTVPGRPDGGRASVAWVTAAGAGATGRVFVSTIEGRKYARVPDRHRTDPRKDLSLPALRAQLDDAHVAPPG